MYSTRDLTFIDDTVEGFLKIIKKNTSGEIINLGTGYDVSILDLVKIISKEMSTKVEIISDKKRIRPKKSEIEKLKANNKKAKKVLGWRPKMSNRSGLIKGISRTIDWFSKKENLENYKPEIYNI